MCRDVALASPVLASELLRRAEALTSINTTDYGSFWQRCLAEAESIKGIAETWVEETRLADVGLLDIGKRPASAHRSSEDAAHLGDMLVGIVSALYGQLYVIGNKKLPGSIHDVRYHEGDDGQELGTGSTELNWHVEDGTHSVRPDWVILYCLRGDPRIVTRVARLVDFDLSMMELEAALTEPVTLSLDTSFNTSKRAAKQVRTLTVEAGRLQLILDPAFTECSSDAARRVVRSIVAQCESHMLEFTLREGQLLIFNNRRTAHWRGAFDPQGGSSRWLKRGLVTEHADECAWIAPGVVAL